MENRRAVEAEIKNSLSARAIAYVYAREKTEEGARGVWGWGEKEEVFFQKVRVFLSKVHVLLPKVRVFFSQVAGVLRLLSASACSPRSMRGRCVAAQWR